LHRDIYMAAGKEPHCLCRPDRSISEYDRIFGEHRSAVYYGDSSTMYMILPAVLPTIRAHADAPRFIFVLRNPVDRAWSHYWWARGRTGREPLPFKDAFSRDMAHEPRMPCVFNNYYFQCGRYSHWLGFYESEFGRDSTLIVAFEDLVARPVATLEAIWKFLRLPPTAALEPQRENPTTVIRFPSLFRSHAALGRHGRHVLGGLIPPRTMEKLTKVYRWSRGKLLSATTIGKPPSMDMEVRRWIAEHYRSDVRELRNTHAVFRDQWTTDFPNP
jgi:hypothetical protein